MLLRTSRRQKPWHTMCTAEAQAAAGISGSYGPTDCALGGVMQDLLRLSGHVPFAAWIPV